MNEIDQLIALAIAHQWVPLAALAIWIVVRLLKTEQVQQRLPIPARYRPLVATGLGLVAGVLDAVAAGTPWIVALLRGGVAAVVAMAGHDVVVEALLGGREGRSSSS